MDVLRYTRVPLSAHLVGVITIQPFRAICFKRRTQYFSSTPAQKKKARVIHPPLGATTTGFVQPFGKARLRCFLLHHPGGCNLDPILELIAKAPNHRLNGPGRRIAKCADRVPFDVVGDIHQ
jgi:hypothetical protein